MRKLILVLLLCAPVFGQDWSDPAFWGLPKGSYIPRPGCWGGTFAIGHNKHKQFDFETCAVITYLEEK